MNVTPPEIDTRFGSGWISGMLSTVLGLMSLGAVFCLLFPEWLTSPHLREVYPMDLIRGLIQFAIGISFILGCLSLALRPTKTLGAVGVASSTLATLLGGSEVPVHGPVNSPTYIGLDWFVLDLFLLALVFVPVERVFGRLKKQPILRFGWKTDLAHFFVSHIIVQMLILATMLPATVLFNWAAGSGFQNGVRSQPLWLQFAAIVFVADLAEYWIHRAFHAAPFLWRFHAVHHSARQMDWLAGSRLHLLDIVLTRAVAFVPLYLLGFSPAAITAYLVFVSFHAVFIHANFRPRWKWMEPWFGTPLFHHWHHAEEPEAVDKNFAIHLPWLDRLFGTFYMPDRWPSAYGIRGHPVPEGYLRQLVWPFRRRD
jgi:lathosterol oxidase